MIHELHGITEQRLNALLAKKPNAAMYLVYIHEQFVFRPERRAMALVDLFDKAGFKRVARSVNRNTGNDITCMIKTNKHKQLRRPQW